VAARRRTAALSHAAPSGREFKPPKSECRPDLERASGARDGTLVLQVANRALGPPPDEAASPQQICDGRRRDAHAGRRLDYRRWPVPRPLGPVFHPAATRDALGVMRLLFALERDGIDITRPAELTDIGQTLGQCLKMGIDMADRQETLGYRAAVSRSAEAMDKLLAMGWPAEVAEVVRVAQGRVMGEQPRREDERDHKRKVREGRG
jgi:hypothetical protein